MRGRPANVIEQQYNRNDVFADIVNLALALKLKGRNFTRVKPEDLEDATIAD